MSFLNFIQSNREKYQIINLICILTSISFDVVLNTFGLMLIFTSNVENEKVLGFISTYKIYYGGVIFSFFIMTITIIFASVHIYNRFIAKIFILNFFDIYAIQIFFGILIKSFIMEFIMLFLMIMSDDVYFYYLFSLLIYSSFVLSVQIGSLSIMVYKYNKTPELTYENQNINQEMNNILPLEIMFP